MDVNEELKFCENSKKKGGVGLGCQSGCELRIEVFVKIQKGGSGEGSGWM